MPTASRLQHGGEAVVSLDRTMPKVAASTVRVPGCSRRKGRFR